MEFKGRKIPLKELRLNKRVICVCSLMKARSREDIISFMVKIQYRPTSDALLAHLQGTLSKLQRNRTLAMTIPQSYRLVIYYLLYIMFYTQAVSLPLLLHAIIPWLHTWIAIMLFLSLNSKVWTTYVMLFVCNFHLVFAIISCIDKLCIRMVILLSVVQHSPLRHYILYFFALPYPWTFLWNVSLHLFHQCFLGR